jgi:hypothetical protein
MFHAACLLLILGAEPEPKRLEPVELPALWDDLIGADAARAFQAVCRLGSAPDVAVPFLRARLKPIPRVEPARYAQWIADLDSDDFKTREKAAREIEQTAEQAVPVLKAALDAKPSPELRRQAKALLEGLEKQYPLSGERLRAVRAIEALERMNTDDARTLLEALSKGAPEARLTREARESLDRLRRLRMR